MFKSIPPITKHLLLINLLAFVAYLVLRGQNIDINQMFGLHFFLASDFHIYQFLTYMFLHANLEHIFFNMFGLWMFGCVMERVWGGKRFLFYYMVCGIGAGLLQELTQLADLYFSVNNGSQQVSLGQLLTQLSPVERTALNALNMVGASGAIYAVLLAFGMTFPNERIFIFPLPIPIKAKWFITFYIAIELFSALATQHSQVAHFAHLGGMLFGFLLIRYWRKHPSSQYFDSNATHDTVLERMRRTWEQHNQQRTTSTQQPGDTVIHSAPPQQEKKQKKAVTPEEKEVDRILDKIKQNGYDSLTSEEKRYLFEAGNRRNRQ